MEVAPSAPSAEGAEGAEVAEGAWTVAGLPIYILPYGQNTMGIGYMALWSFGAKSWMDWMGDGWYPLGL